MPRFEEASDTPVNPERREQEREIEQDEKMNFSSKLIERPILDGEPGYDKIFLLGEVKEGEGEWKIEIKSDTPTVALDQETKNEFALGNSPTVQEVRDRKIPSNLSLISGGTFMWLTQKGKSELLLLRRDAKALLDAGYLTGPAGRCGEAPSLTSINESNEELIIIKSRSLKGSDRFKLIGFCRDENERDVVAHQKLRQVKTIHDYLLSQGRIEDARLLQLIRGEDDIEMFNMSSTQKPSNYTDRVVTCSNGEEIDVVENGVVYFDSQTNTLEIREVVDIHLPEGTEVVQVLDGETFGRDVVTVPSLEALKGEKIVSSLQEYCRRMSAQP